MIEGIKISSDVNNILDKLDKSQYKFWLTGSRYFEEKTDCDWDFYSESSQGIIYFLQELGFKCCDNDPSYIGVDSLKVYRIFPETEEHIDIQLVDDINEKHVCQRELKKVLSNNVVVFSKSIRTKLWRAAHNVYNAGKTAVTVSAMINNYRENERQLPVIGSPFMQYINPDDTFCSVSNEELRSLKNSILNREIINLIKWYRGKTKAGLKEAKDVIEANIDTWISMLMGYNGDVLLFDSSCDTGELDFIPLDKEIEVRSAGPGGSQVKATIRELISTDNRMPVIKWLRKAADLGLKETKDLVDQHWDGWRRQLGCDIIPGLSKGSVRQS